MTIDNSHMYGGSGEPTIRYTHSGVYVSCTGITV